MRGETLEVHDHEPSYYEVALTNRQVVTGFVILLVCLFSAFLAGVWMGQEGDGGGRSAGAPSVRAPEAGEAKLDQLTFFGDRGGAAPRAATAMPVASPPVAPPRAPKRAAPTPAETEAEKLRQTLEAEMAQHRTDLDEAAPSPSTAAPAGVAPVGTRVRRKAERSAAATAPVVARAPVAATAPVAAPAAPVTRALAAPATAAPTPAAGAPVWIQVYSSSNGAKAQDLASRLRKSSFQALVLEAASSGGSTFRVRVGPYATRDDADRAASRLRRDYRLDTWITDQP